MNPTRQGCLRLPLARESRPRSLGQKYATAFYARLSGAFLTVASAIPCGWGHKFLPLLVCFTLMGQATFCFGEQKDGVVKKYHYPSGALQAEITYKDEKMESIARQYYENGRLKRETNFKDGQQEGVAREYYESGKLMVEGSLKGGKRDGVSKGYDENGTLRAEISYRNGVEIHAKEYNATGKLVSEK